MKTHNGPLMWKIGTLRKVTTVLLVVVALVLLSATAVLAQGDSQAPTDPQIPTEEAVRIFPDPQPPEPNDIYCVTGTVTDHAEQPLPDRTVTATYEGVNGNFAPVSARTNQNGRFRLDLDGPGRWRIDIEYDKPWEGVTSTSMAVHVGFGHMECIDVKFKLRMLVEVIVIKIDDEHIPQADWVITATPGEGNEYGQVQTAVTDEEGKAYFSLTPGNWIFTEAAPDGVAFWRPISPPTGQHRINVVGPETYVIRFKNQIVDEPNTCIDVRKIDVPASPDEEPFGLAGWTIQVLTADGTVVRQTTTDSFGNASFRELPYGPYTVREVMEAGWEAASPTSYSVVLTSRDDGCAQITFINKQIPKGFCITGRKLDAYRMVGIPDWEIRLEPTEPGDPAPQSVLTDGEGRYLICLPLEDYRVPGSVYRVTEVIPVGWEAVSPTAFDVVIPQFPDVPVVVPNFVNRQSTFAGETPIVAAARVVTSSPTWGSCTAAHTGSTGCTNSHVVKSGESVYKLANKYGVSASSILSDNPWINDQCNQWLFVGQTVCIP